MPNWCDNDIKISFNGKLTDEEKNKIDEMLKEGDNTFSFNKIIPQPKILIKCAIGQKTRENKSKWFKKYKNKAPEHVIIDCLSNGEYYYEIGGEWNPVEYFKEEGIEIEKDEYIPTWYDWNYTHWGTKWNSNVYFQGWEEDGSDNSFLEIGVSTAWDFGADRIIPRLFEMIKESGFNINFIEGSSEEPGNDIGFNFDAYWDDDDNEVIYSESENEELEYQCDKCGDILHSKQQCDGLDCYNCDEGVYNER